MNKVIILDGYNLLFRAYYATYNEDKSRQLQINGIYTNAIYAFANMLLKIMSTLKKGDGLFIALDSSKTTFRHQEYKDYKANRRPLDPDLKMQFPILRELLDALNVSYYEDAFLEADDIAGIVAKMMEKANYKVEIYTADKDYLQLIDDNITINLIKQGLSHYNEMTPTSFKNEWGIEPIQIIDYKALRGDDSDNLKGIPGVGDKTAKALIQQYGTLDNIIKNANTKTKVGKNLLEFKEDAKLCYRLATINLNYEISLSPNDVIYEGYDILKATEFKNKYSFNNFLNKLPVDYKITSSSNFEINYEIVNNFDFVELPKDFGLSIDIDENTNYHHSTLKGISISFNNKNYYIEKNNLLNDSKLLSIIKDENYKKYVYDFKKIKYVLNKNNIEINGLEFDLLLASYLLNSNTDNSISNILLSYSIDVDYNFNSCSLLLDNNPKLTSIYSFFSLYLYKRIIQELKEKNLYQLLTEIEQPLSIVLEDMEKEGFPLDKDTLLSFKEEYTSILDKLKKEIYSLSNEEFNINSPKQLSEILYDKLKLPEFNKSKSTNAETLYKLISYHPIIEKIIEYRKYQKLISTYIDGYLPYIDDDGLIHATFNQAITSTGRLSSSEPNLQNVSVRDEDLKNIRKAFFYKDPSLNILSLDYSQIELRILAHLSSSQSMIDAFNNDEDIHSLTAKTIFNLDHEPSDEQRRIAKACNFGIVYGISDWGLAEQLHIQLNESREIISSFYHKFPEIKEYLLNLIEFAKINKYTLTMFNRRRYLEEINNSNYQERNFEKRAAMNAPIQGSAADIIKIAMIESYKELNRRNLKSKIINQIHDEIILKVYDDEKDEVLELIQNIMKNCVKLKVKLKVSGGYAKDWYNAK